MSNLTELTAQIIAARAAKKDMSTEELRQEIQMVSNMLKSIDAGTTPEATPATPSTPEPPKPEKINFKKIFKDNEIICLLCNKGFISLKRHLKMAHNVSDKDYRKQFDIPAKQALIAKAFSEKMKKAAVDRGQGGILAKAREAKAAKAGSKPAKAKAANK